MAHARESSVSSTFDRAVTASNRKVLEETRREIARVQRWKHPSCSWYRDLVIS